MEADEKGNLPASEERRTDRETMQAGKRVEAEQLSILDLAVAAASDCVWVSALATCSMNKNVAVWA